jgi:2-dehydropantoate 2-reductase
MKDGLVIKSTKGDITQKVKTVLSGSEGGPYDVVMLTNKAYDLASAMDAVAPSVGSNSTVLPLLNGMRHIETLAKRFGDAKVVGGLARVGVALSAEGAILHTSPFAAISFGERDGKAARPVLCELDAAVKKAGIDGGLNANIVQDLWDKWIMLASLAATCCLMRGTSGDILEADEGQAIVLETVEECRKVAAAAGCDPGRPCGWRYDRAGETGRYRHAQPAHGLCPFAGLFGASRPWRHRQTGHVTLPPGGLKGPADRPTF